MGSNPSRRANDFKALANRLITHTEDIDTAEPQRGCQLIRRAEFGVRCNKSQKAVKHTLKNNCGNLVGCHVGATRFWLRLAMQRKCRHLGAPRPLQVA